MTIRAFITYAHASEDHKDAVRDLANHLRRDGIDAIIDQFEAHPAEGWAKWMELQFHRADRIILVPSEKYQERYFQEGPPSSGARFEGALLTTHLLLSGVSFAKIAVAVADRADATFIPDLLQTCQRYEFRSQDGYDALYRWLTEQPAVMPAPLGIVRKLPPISAGDVAQAATRRADGGRFGLLCNAMRPLLEENGRIFRDFGPNSGSKDSDRPLRMDFNVWKFQREKTIVPNNAHMRELVTKNYDHVPQEHRPIFDRLLSHFDAFEAHVRFGSVDYRDHQFPVEINEIVAGHS